MSTATELVTDLADHRTRRNELRPAHPPATTDADSSVVTVLVIAVPGAVDQRWLREVVEPHLLSHRQLPAAELSADQLLAQVAPTLVPPPAAQIVPRAAGALSVGPLSMDLDELRVSVSGRRIELTYQEFMLLKTFMLNPSRVFSRQQLLELAWDHYDWGPMRTVDVHVRRVRVKLGPDAPRIVTVRGFGYRFEP
ncbi:transcriptional regulator [Jatrophihabitans sp. GAS493]|uniref:winged helix-turn-helix domain-containing protein n=1 Tax=Jatrophihabitans sp. GAS493 TaxID=1907575 RepID=UPI000BC0667F|nr:winged helix-turn-helix domain-containing protein [Jatrophihabitans sp. GAS493]SOD72215.1 transcriptional regulator [Jatrophihabitans sp. GAS493]